MTIVKSEKALIWIRGKWDISSLTLCVLLENRFASITS